jgi:hypothetical protein
VSPCAAIALGTVVLLGTVQSVEPFERARSLGFEGGRRETVTEQWARYRFSVEERWDGLDATEAVVEAQVADGGNCGVRLEPRITYLVYAQRHEGALVTSMCTRTAPADQRQADLDVLRARRAGVPESRLIGRVLRLRTDIRPVGFRDRPSGGLAGVRVELRGPDVVREARTDADGAFEIRGLPAGRYEVVPELSGPYQLRFPLRPVEFDGCLAEVPVFTAARSLQGTVVLADGSPAGKNVMVAVVPVAPTPGAPYVPAFTDERGSWSMPGLPAGRYRLAVNVYAPPTAAAPSGPTWYPGAATEADAQALDVRDDTPQDVQIRLREQLPVRRIAVRVLNERGAPVPDVSIDLVDTAELPQGTPPSLKSAARATSDKSGRCVVDGLVSRAYRVEAKQGRRGATPTPLTATAEVGAGEAAVSVVLRLKPPAR